jgi:hypothetical protein
MLKKLPGLIWTTAILGYLFKRFRPDDPAVWVHSMASKSRTLVGTDSPSDVDQHDAEARVIDELERGLDAVGKSHADEGSEIA